MKFFLKVHEYDDEKLVAICDKEVLGRTLQHNDITLQVKEQFYRGMELSSDEVLIELHSATSFNVFGKNICNLLIEHNLIHPATVLWIKDDKDKIGHAIMVR